MNNAAAIGYMILAAKRLGVDADTVKNLEWMMRDMMDTATEDEAEEAYRQS